MSALVGQLRAAILKVVNETQKRDRARLVADIEPLLEKIEKLLDTPPTVTKLHPATISALADLLLSIKVSKVFKDRHWHIGKPKQFEKAVDILRRELPDLQEITLK